MGAHVWVTAATVVWTFGASLVPAGPVEAAVTCGGERATIVGTEGHDVLRGTSGDDVIVGGDGGDTVFAFGGDDLVCGEGGSDWLVGHSGRDRLYGGQGSDRLEAGRGPDRLYGGPDLPVVNGEEVQLFGDHLWGGGGDDKLLPGYDRRPADVRVRDELVWQDSPARVRIDLAHGMAVGDGHDTFPTGPVHVIGSRHRDLVVGSARADQVDAGPGADEVHGLAGDDVIDAEQPFDEDADFSDDDVVYGGAGDDQVHAAMGSDLLYGGDGRDHIQSTLGTPDRVFAGSGDDAVLDEFAGGAAEVISGGPGRHDLLRVDDAVTVERPARGTFDMVTGRLTFQNSEQHVAVGVPGFENVYLDYFSADSTTWHVRGSRGDNRVRAGGSNGTTFDALGGDDVFWGGNGPDRYLGGPGVDAANDMRSSDRCRSVERFPDSGTCTTIGP